MLDHRGGSGNSRLLRPPSLNLGVVVFSRPFVPGQFSHPVAVKMRVTNWHRNDSIDAFGRFCDQNRNELISIRLIGVREVINGVLYSYRLRPLVTAGIFILLTRAVIHPAFYSLDDLESLHFLGPAVPQPSHDLVLIV